MLNFYRVDKSGRQLKNLLLNTYSRLEFDPENDVMEDLVIELAAEIEHCKRTIEIMRKNKAKQEKEKRENIKNNFYVNVKVNNYMGYDPSDDTDDAEDLNA